MKSSVDGLSSRTKRTEERFEREQQKLPTMNNTEKREQGAENNRASEACETITKDLIFLSLESQEERRKKAGLKI